MLSRVTYSMEISLSYAMLLASLLLPLLYLLFSLRKNPSNGHGGRIPSPPAFPVIGHIHLLKKPLHRSLGALAARYGGGTGLLLLRFGNKRVLLVSSPAIAEECLTVHDVALADRPGFPSLKRLTDDFPNILTSNYGPFWRHLRRLVTVHALSPHRLSLTTSVRDAEVRAMARKLWRAGPGAVSVKSAAHYFVVNVVMVMVAGKRMPEEDVLRFKELTEKAMAEMGAANLHDFLPVLKLLDFGRMERRLADVGKERTEFAQRLVDDYRRLHPRAGDAEETTPRTLIGDLLWHQERSPESYDDAVIRTVCMDLMEAGTDTSSCTVEWAMALLLNHPAALAKVAAEIDAVVGTSRLLQESDLAGLPYLRSVVAETLRLYPPGPHLFPHEASRDCALAVGGGQYTIERGTMVLVDIFSMQRDAAAWEEPDSFVPERFLAANADDKQVTATMMPFSMGRRKCPGEGLAWRTVGVAVGVMVQCFEWEHAGEVDMSERPGMNLPMAVPLVATFRPRQKMVEVLKTL